MTSQLSRYLTKERLLLARKRFRTASKWTVLAVLAAAIGVPVTLGLTELLIDSDSSESSGSPSSRSDKEARDANRDPFEGELQHGYGPPRAAFRCARPTACEGPQYVTFNSYYNTPNYGDERAFLNVKHIDDPIGSVWNDTLRIERSTTLQMRAYIDNNAYQNQPGQETTDAVDTRLRLALPEGPVYGAHPTAYLRAENARPQVIWDTVFLYASRPMTMAYVQGSAEITHRKDGGDFVTETAAEGVDTPEGMELGRWKADFVNSALVTFRVRVSFLAEPVRDPLATWQSHLVDTVTLPPASTGPRREPEIDGSVGAQFSCDSDSCTGAPYVTLNAYRNHPLLGDEADFLRGELTSTYGDTGEHRYGSAVHVRPGDRLYVRVAIDNGADPDAIGAPPSAQLVARDIHVRVMLPKGPANSQDMVAFIESPAASPAEISDALPIRSDEPVRIRYRPGTASIASSRTSTRAGERLFALSDEMDTAEPGRDWGIGVPDIPPSFSRVTYVGFTIVAWAA